MIKFRNKMDGKKMSVMCAKPESYENRVRKSEFARRASLVRRCYLVTLTDVNVSKIDRKQF